MAKTAALDRTNGSELTTSLLTTMSTEPIVSYRTLLIFQWVVLTVICLGIDVFGVAGNVINIICFVKQGFKDSVNISLLGLAVSDIGCLSTLIWSIICLTPAFASLDLPFEPIEFQHLTSALPHATCIRTTAWITALVTLERCLCITAPLLVKSIVTPRRVSIIVGGLFIILIFSASPMYAVNRLEKKFYPLTNKTLLGIVVTGDHEMVERVSYAINNIFISFTAFVLIVVCTVVLVIKLYSLAKWREKSTPSAQGDNISNRNLKVARLVVMISSLFIACFVPVSSIFIAMSIMPELSVQGRLRPILILAAGLGIVLESINSSVNIIVYYNMSTKYRIVFRELFCIKIIPC